MNRLHISLETENDGINKKIEEIKNEFYFISECSPRNENLNKTNLSNLISKSFKYNNRKFNYTYIYT
jgi:hypothetical protein